MHLLVAEQSIHLEAIQTATAAHTRYPSSPPAATLHGKTHGFCSHSNAICNDRFKKRIELRTQKLAEHRGGTNSRMKRPRPQPPHAGGTFHRRLQSFYTEKHQVSCSGFLPNTSPMQRSCSHHNAFCSMTWLTHMYLPTWQHRMTTIMQPFQCDLQPQIQETHRTTHTETTTRSRGGIADETTPAAAAHRR